MPYTVKQNDGKWCVYKKGSSSPIKGGCHGSKTEAVKHMQALNINVEGGLQASFDALYELLLEEAGRSVTPLTANSVTTGTTMTSPKLTAQAPVLVTVPNVPVVEAGVEYMLASGPMAFTPEDLADAVVAANEDPSIPSPRLKIGHSDPRYNDSQTYDGSPSFGKATNLRLSENGMVVYADYVGVPKWLAEIMSTAYPSRSIEGYKDFPAQSGKNWRLVISAVAALGVTWPGVQMLEDLPAYYGEEVPDGVEVDEELIAAGKGEESEAMKLKAAANLDDIRRAFYNEYVEANSDQGTFFWWVRAVMTDPNQLVIEDDEDGQLYLLSFSSDAKGNVAFGDPEPVRVDYVPDDRKKEAAASVAATLVVGHQVLASYESREDSLPETTTQGGAVDPKEIRRNLGLPEDASDEDVQAKLQEVAAATGLTLVNEADPGETSGDEPPAPEQAPVQPAAVPAAAAASPQPSPRGADVLSEPRPGGGPSADDPDVRLDRSQYEALVTAAGQGQQAYQRLEEIEHNRILDDAIAAGKFPPSRREAWAKYMKTDPDGAKEAIAKLEPGLVPVGAEIGSPGTATEDSAVPPYPVELFPEVAKRRRSEQIVAAGLGVQSRIQTDGSMRRGGNRAF